MSILNLLRRKKKREEEVFFLQGEAQEPTVFPGQAERGILIDMGDIVTDRDAADLSVNAAAISGIPVYFPELNADHAKTEARLLVDISALQTNGTANGVTDSEVRDKLDGTEPDLSHEQAGYANEMTLENTLAAPERKRRYGHQEASLSADKPNPFNDGIIIIAEWEHTEPGGVIGFDPGMNAANAWMTERSSPLLIIDKEVDLTLQTAVQEASDQHNHITEINPQDLQNGTAAEQFTISAEDYTSLSSREIIDSVLAKWQGLDSDRLSTKAHQDKAVYNQEELDAALKGLRDNLLAESNGNAENTME